MRQRQEPGDRPHRSLQQGRYLGTNQPAAPRPPLQPAQMEEAGSRASDGVRQACGHLGLSGEPIHSAISPRGGDRRFAGSKFTNLCVGRLGQPQDVGRGPWPRSPVVVAEIFAKVPPAVTRKIVLRNAAKLLQSGPLTSRNYQLMMKKRVALRQARKSSMCTST